jgi:hypothetical protein
LEIAKKKKRRHKMNLKRIASFLRLEKRWEINLFFFSLSHSIYTEGSINDLLRDTDAENTVNDIISSECASVYVRDTGSRRKRGREKEK